MKMANSGCGPLTTVHHLYKSAIRPSVSEWSLGWVDPRVASGRVGSKFFHLYISQSSFWTAKRSKEADETRVNGGADSRMVLVPPAERPLYNYAVDECGLSASLYRRQVAILVKHGKENYGNNKRNRFSQHHCLSSRSVRL